MSAVLPAVVTTVNPVDGSLLAEYPAMTPADVEAALEATADAARVAVGPVARRVELLRALADHLRAQTERYAALVTAEMGKPLAEARGEVAKSALTADWYAASSAALLAPRRSRSTLPQASPFVTPEPLGVVLAVMPWNFPVWQVMRAAIPTVAAGNALLLKHAPNVTGSALLLQQAFVDAGFPEGLVTTLVVAEPDVPATVEGLVGDPRVAAVTLTGSNRAGEMVGAAAGGATKPSVLELGGSDAFVVLDDADVPAAAAAAVRSRFTNGGQSCVCAKRFVVHEAVAEAFTRLFVEGTRALVVGDPTEPETQVGPLARGDLRDALQRQVDQSVLAGATSPPEVDRSTARATSTSRPCCWGPGRGCRCSTRRPSARWPRSRWSATTRQPPSSRTPRHTGWGSACGAARWTGRSRWRPESRAGRSSSTRWSRPTRDCPSAAPGAAVTDASSRRPACWRSRTSAPGGWRAEPQGPAAVGRSAHTRGSPASAALGRRMALSAPAGWRRGRRGARDARCAWRGRRRTRRHGRRVPVWWTVLRQGRLLQPPTRRCKRLASHGHGLLTSRRPDSGDRACGSATS